MENSPAISNGLNLANKNNDIPAISLQSDARGEQGQDESLLIAIHKHEQATSLSSYIIRDSYFFPKITSGLFVTIFLCIIGFFPILDSNPALKLLKDKIYTQNVVDEIYSSIKTDLEYLREKIIEGDANVVKHLNFDIKLIEGYSNLRNIPKLSSLKTRNHSDISLDLIKYSDLIYTQAENRQQIYSSRFSPVDGKQDGITEKIVEDIYANFRLANQIKAEVHASSEKIKESINEKTILLLMRMSGASLIFLLFFLFRENSDKRYLNDLLSDNGLLRFHQKLICPMKGVSKGELSRHIIHEFASRKTNNNFLAILCGRSVDSDALSPVIDLLIEKLIRFNYIEKLDDSTYLLK